MNKGQDQFSNQKQSACFVLDSVLGNIRATKMKTRKS